MELLWYICLGYVITWAFKMVIIFFVQCLTNIVILAVILLGYVLLSLTIDMVFFGIMTVWPPTPEAPPPPLPEVDLLPWPQWEVIATFDQSANETFQRVVVCDSELIDDPLHPHVSIVYMVGVKRHDGLTITIWRVSTVTGQREDVCQFNPSIPINQANQEGSIKTTGFYSRGAIFIHIQRGWCAPPCNSLFVYDIRHKKTAEFHLRHEIDHFLPLAILCLGRRQIDATFDGWRIRFVAVKSLLVNGMDWRVMFINATIDLSASNPSSCFIISQEDLSLPPDDPFFVRSEHLFGIWAFSRPGLPIFVYNAITNGFQMFSPQQFYLERSRVFLSRILHLHVEASVMALNPMVLNEYEAVHGHVDVENDRVVIMGTRLKTPSLRMSASRSLFKGDPSISMLTAEEFRWETGVDLQGHLQ